MNISRIFEENRTVLSFEFFPPKTKEASERLFKTINELKPLNPGYVSVTYGAGGSTRELTHNLVMRIKKEAGLTVVPHLTCISATKDTIYSILEQYNEIGIRNIMALRGDIPADSEDEPIKDFKNASDLVKFIKDNFPEMGVGVAGFPEGHPETPNRIHEMEYLKRKVDAGADYICTQLFYDNRDFYDYRERCIISGIDIPVIAGIMPVVSMSNMRRISELALGARFPARLLRSLKRAANDENIEKAGLHWSAEQVRDLIDEGVRGIHFYTLNNARRIKQICDTIGISSSEQFNI